MGIEAIVKNLKLTHPNLLQEKNYPLLVDYMRRNHPQAKESSYKRLARMYRTKQTKNEKILMGSSLPGMGSWLADQLNKTL